MDWYLVTIWIGYFTIEVKVRTPQPNVKHCCDEQNRRSLDKRSLLFGRPPPLFREGIECQSRTEHHQGQPDILIEKVPPGDVRYVWNSDCDPWRTLFSAYVANYPYTLKIRVKINISLILLKRFDSTRKYKNVYEEEQLIDLIKYYNFSYKSSLKIYRRWSEIFKVS